MSDLLTRYAVGQVVNDATLGMVTIQEVHPPTLNSPEQYIVSVNATGAIVRAVLTQSGESAAAQEVQTAIDAAEVAQTPLAGT